MDLPANAIFGGPAIPAAADAHANNGNDAPPVMMKGRSGKQLKNRDGLLRTKEVTKLKKR